MSGYYSSAQYQQDKANGRGPPPASQGGPTAFEIYRHEGLVDEKGFLLSSPNVHMLTAAMYGGGPQKITNNQSLNPDYAAGNSGNTVGGISNTDGWGSDIDWNAPITGTATEGQIFQTGAGDYKVTKNPWGQFELQPMEGAIRSTNHSVTNFSSGGHHLGINPNTGEVWYQSAGGKFAPSNTAGSGTLISANTTQQQNQETPENPLVAQQNQIKGLYQSLLGRDPREAGLDYWMGDLAKGQTLDQVEANMRLTPEYLARQAQNQAVQQASAQRARQEKTGMLSGDNPEWSALSNTGTSMSGGMGPFMLGQLAKRR